MHRLVFSAFLVASAAGLARADDTQPPLIHHTPTAKATKGDAVTINAQMEDESEIFAPTLYFRYPGARGYSSVAMTRKGDAFVATVQATADVEYWIEAYDEFGNGPTREGSPDRPHRIAVAERAAPKPMPVAVKEVPPPAPEPVAAPPAPEPAPEPAPAFEANKLTEPPPLAITEPPLPPDAFLPGEEPEQKPFYKQWWFLGSTGAVVTAGVVAAVILGQPDPIYQNTFSASFRRP